MRLGRACVDLVVAHAVEVEHDFDVRKISEAGGGFAPELGGIEHDRGFDFACR